MEKGSIQRSEIRSGIPGHGVCLSMASSSGYQKKPRRLVHFKVRMLSRMFFLGMFSLGGVLAISIRANIEYSQELAALNAKINVLVSLPFEQLGAIKTHDL